jgi:outer membrane protein
MLSKMQRFNILFFVCIAVSASAQSPNKLTFKEAVKIGLDNNLALNQAKNNLNTTTAQKNANLLGLTPSVNVSGNAGRNDGNSFNQQQGEVVNGILDFMGANLNASMPLFNGLSNVNLYRQSIESNDAQMHTVKRTSQDVIRNIASQFLTCLLDQQLAIIQQKNVETQQQQYNQIKELVAAGSRAEVDAYNQEYQVKNAELLLLRAQNTLRNDKAVLLATLQIDPSLLTDLEEPTWDVNVADTDTQSLDQLNELALSQRSDFLATKSLERSSQLSYYSTKGTYLPNISAFAQYGSQYNYIHPSASFTADNRSFNDQFLKDNVQLTYGVSFTIPIFGGFQTRSSVVRTKMTYENAKLTTESTEIIVKTNVLLAQQNYNDAKANYEASQAQLRAADISYNLEKDRYTLGISDVVALTLATQNYTRAQSDAANARYTLMFQKLLINYATGTLRFEDIP